MQHEKHESPVKVKGNIVRIVVIIIAAIVLFFCLYNIISYFLNVDKEENEYSVLKTTYKSDSSESENISEIDKSISNTFLTGFYNDEKYTYDPTFTDYRDSLANVDVLALRKEYPSITGWIYIPGTKISYPLIASKGDQYLYKNYRGNSAKSGSIFYYNSASFNPQDDNIIIYGHNMKSGLMFGSLKAFWLEDAMWPADKELIIYLILEDKIQQYEIFSLYIDNPKKNKIPSYFETDQKKIDYFNQVLKKSYRYKNIDFKESDCFITLSTCTHIDYAASDDRLIMHARLIK